MARNTQIKTKIKSTKKEQVAKRENSKNSIWDVLKFGESYTSLVLGIVAVIIATIILITFVKGRENISRLADDQQAAIKNTQDVTNKLTINTKQNLSKDNKLPITPSPTIAIVGKTDSKTITNNYSAIKSTNNLNKSISSTVYTVTQGDTLWNIAERKYKSGYNWVDIKAANKLANPDLLYAGQKLILPNVAEKTTTVIVEGKAVKTGNQVTNNEVKTNKISGTSYTVIKGDTLWDIAVRAYGDGYAWPKIAKANKLVSPNVIHSGNKLTIPRG